MSSEKSDTTVDHVANTVAKEREDLPASSPSETAERSFQNPSPGHLFNRQRSLHKILGGGKAADSFLWRDKVMSVGILVGASIIYFVLEHSGYTLLQIVSTLLMITLGIMFVLSNIAAIFNRDLPPVPEFHLSEEKAESLAFTFRDEVNKGLAVVHDLILGKDFKLLLKVGVVLWGLSVVGGWFHFLTLMYLAVLVSHTVPAIYERYEGHIDMYAKRAYDGADMYAKKAYEGAQHRYRDIDEKYLRKLPKAFPGAKKAE